MKGIFLILLTVMLYSCSKGGDDRLAEQERIKAEEQVQAENENLRQKAEAMEADLDKRKNFFKGIKGKFEGDLTISNTDYVMTVEINPSLPIEFYSRVRTLEEINYEIQNLDLGLNIKVKNPRVANSSVSCTVTSYKSTDLASGLLNIISENCQNILKMYISSDLESRNVSETQILAQKISKDLVGGDIESIDYFDAIFEPKVGSGQYKIKLKRVGAQEERAKDVKDEQPINSVEIKMEQDLNHSKRFIQSIEGKYTGEITVEGTMFEFSADIIPNIPIKYHNRVRNIDEINYEIQKIGLNINIKIKNPEVANSGVSCSVEDFKPDFDRGRIYIFSKSCNNIFKFNISSNDEMQDLDEQEKQSFVLSQKLKKGTAEKVQFLKGVFETKVSPKSYEFVLERSL